MAQKASSKKSTPKVSAKKGATMARASGGGRGGVVHKPVEKVKAATKPVVAGKASAPAAKAPVTAAKGPGAMKARPGLSGGRATMPTPNGSPAGIGAKAESGQVKKAKAPSLSKQDLQYYRNLLLERRREIIGDVGSMESEAFKGGSNLSNMPIHMADVGTDNFEQEFTLGLIESERQMLRDIQEALIRIDDGTYGICQGTHVPIPRVRLEAVPWAKYTKEYQLLLEQGKVARDEGQSSEEESSGGDDDED